MKLIHEFKSIRKFKIKYNVTKI